MDVSDIAAQVVAMKSQSVQTSLAMAATKQVLQQQQNIVNLLTESAVSLPAGDGQRGSVVDILV